MVVTEMGFVDVGRSIIFLFLLLLYLSKIKKSKLVYKILIAYLFFSLFVRIEGTYPTEYSSYYRQTFFIAQIISLGWFYSLLNPIDLQKKTIKFVTIIAFLLFVILLISSIYNTSLSENAIIIQAVLTFVIALFFALLHYNNRTEKFYFFNLGLLVYLASFILLFVILFSLQLIISDAIYGKILKFSVLILEIIFGLFLIEEWKKCIDNE